MKKKIIYILIILFSIAPAFTEENALKLMKEVDYKCIPSIADFDWELKVFYNDGYNSDTKFLGKKNGISQFMFYTYYPNKSFGNVYLRIDDTIWNYYPMADVTTRTVMRTNILNSNVDYFDVLFDDLIDNYSSKIISEDSKTTCVELKIINKENKQMDEFYPKVLLYINSENKTPIKREYFSSDNEIIKTITFSDYKFENDKVKGFSMKVVSNFDSDKYSTASFNNFEEKDSLAKKYFTIGFLKNWIPDLGGLQ